jgi:hypothetical protein
VLAASQVQSEEGRVTQVFVVEAWSDYMERWVRWCTFSDADRVNEILSEWRETYPETKFRVSKAM